VGKLKEIDYNEDIEVDGTMILKLIIKKFVGSGRRGLDRFVEE